jgi:outer membrane lipoprotein carrier protein
MTSVRLLSGIAVLWMAAATCAAQTTGGDSADRQAVSQSSQLKELTDRVDRHYNSITTMTAEFTESYTSAGNTRTESGTLWLKKPGKMLWNYTSPRPKVFLSDGKTAYFYVIGETEGRKMPVKKLDDFRSPLRYLLGHAKLQKEFSSLRIVDAGTGGASEKNTVTIAGVPNGMSEQIANVELTIRDGNIVGIKIEQNDGSVTAFSFRGERDNLPIEDAKFRPQAPAGTHWIESTDAAIE